jgi:site-specific recombinase XerD
VAGYRDAMTLFLGYATRHLLPSLLHNTGARVSEIVGVRVVDVVPDGAACVHLHGKGRKDRSVPLWKSTAVAIRTWLHAFCAWGSPWMALHSDPVLRCCRAN